MLERETPTGAFPQTSDLSETDIHPLPLKGEECLCLFSIAWSRDHLEKVSVQVSLLMAILNGFIFNKLDIGRCFFATYGSDINNYGFFFN